MAEAGLEQMAQPRRALTEANLRRRRAVIRVLLVLAMLAATAGAVVAYGDPEQIARASDSGFENAAAPRPGAGARRAGRARQGRRVRAARQDQRRQGADGDRHRRNLGGADLGDRESDRAADRDARIQCRCRNRRRTHQGGAADARPPRGRRRWSRNRCRRWWCRAGR